MPDTKHARTRHPRGGQAEDFARQADRASVGFFSELWAFLKTTKKWWLTPIIVVLVVVGVLILLGSTVLAPFIYPLF